MSYKYLQDYIYYSELYDRMTIEECECWDSAVLDTYEKSGKKLNPTKPSRKLHGGLVADLRLYFIKGERYLNKETTISKWMERAKEKDEKLEKAIEPKSKRCLHYSEPLTRVISKALMTDSKGNEEVVFMFECDKCQKRRVYWEDGTEWKIKPTLCSKSQSEMDSFDTKKKKGIETVYSCPKCGHKETDFLDLSKKEEDKIDPDFEKKRKKYCLSEKEGTEYYSEKENLKQMAELGKKWKDEEDNKELYDAVRNIKKLTISELQNLLNPLIEKASYTKLEFEKPDLQKDVILGFSVQDSKSGRSDQESIYDLQRLLKFALKPTNWRLMSDGVNYRLGYLQGRLKGVEGEEKLRKLIENDILKKIKK